jgi:hypothetical protein
MDEALVVFIHGDGNDRMKRFALAAVGEPSKARYARQISAKRFPRSVQAGGLVVQWSLGLDNRTCKESGGGFVGYEGDLLTSILECISENLQNGAGHKHQFWFGYRRQSWQIHTVRRNCMRVELNDSCIPFPFSG